MDRAACSLRPADVKATGRQCLQPGRLTPALCALLLIDRAEAEHLSAALFDSSEEILVFKSDVVSPMQVRDIAALVRERDLGRLFRQRRDETDAYFGSPVVQHGS